MVVVMPYTSLRRSTGWSAVGNSSEYSFRFARDPGAIAEAEVGMRRRFAQGDENTAPFLYFLSKGRASKKISLRMIRPSLNVIKAAARQTPIGAEKSIS